jgi:hypothetical protein
MSSKRGEEATNTTGAGVRFTTGDRVCLPEVGRRGERLEKEGEDDDNDDDKPPAEEEGVAGTELDEENGAEGGKAGKCLVGVTAITTADDVVAGETGRVDADGDGKEQEESDFAVGEEKQIRR